MLAEAGFGPNKKSEARPESELLDRFAELALELGRLPVKSEMRLRKRSDPTFPNERTYARFGTKADLLAQLRIHCLSNERFTAIVPLIDASQQANNKNNHAPQQLAEGEIEIGFVYLLRSGGYYKIGRSNSVGRREREIALQLPEKVMTTHVIRTDDPVGIEAYWHRRFADRRKNGEWFDLTVADVFAFKRRKFM